MTRNLIFQEDAVVLHRNFQRIDVQRNVARLLLWARFKDVYEGILLMFIERYFDKVLVIGPLAFEEVASNGADSQEKER